MSLCTLSSISVSVYFLFYITFCQMLFKICPISNSESIINGKDIIYSSFNLTDLFLQTRFLTHFARICLLKWPFDRLFTIFGKLIQLRYIFICGSLPATEMRSTKKCIAVLSIYSLDFYDWTHWLAQLCHESMHFIINLTIYWLISKKI